MSIFKRTLSAALGIAMLGSAASTGEFTSSALTLTPQTVQQKWTDIKKDIVQKLKQTDKDDYAKGEAVIMVDSSVPVKSGTALDSSIDIDSSEISVKQVEKFKERKNGFSVATVSSDKLSTEKLVKTLSKNDDILIAEPNYKYHAFSITKDAYSDFQWALDNNGQNGGTKDEDINPEKLWTDKNPTEKDAPVVAVLDTGVDCTHEDLVNKLWVNPYGDKLPGKHGINTLATSDDKLEVFDDNGHGTHCAGIIAAEQNNNKGISGISQSTKIMGIKWLDAEGYGYTDSAIAGYQYIYEAMKLGVNVVAVNNSWGGSEDSEILKQIINKVGEMGAVSVVAAGNESTDLSEVYDYNTIAEEYDKSGPGYNPDDEGFDSSKKNPHIFSTNPDLSENRDYYTYPACTDSKYIITVGASNEKGKKSDYSNYGDDRVDIFAPGSDILSSVSYDCFNPGIYENPEEKCSFYATKTPEYKTIKVSGKGKVTLSDVENAGMTDASGDSTAIKFSATGAKNGDIYAVEIPYEMGDIEQNPYASICYRINKAPKSEDLGFFSNISAMAIADISADADAVSALQVGQIYYGIVYEPNEYWIHSTANIYTSKKGKRKLVIFLSVAADGDYEIMFDSIGVSKGTKDEDNEFGKYDYMSGTSMAAPAVTGSIALLREQNPKLKAEEAIEAVLDRANQNSEYDYICNCSLKLDLAADNDSSKIPVVYSAMYLNGKAILKGKAFTGCKVKINGEDVKAVIKSNDEINITDPKALNKEAEIKVYNEYGYDLLNRTFNEGEKIGLMSYTNSYFDNYNMVTDGNKIYSGTTNVISVYEYSSEWCNFETNNSYYLDYAEALDSVNDYTKQKLGSMAYSNGVLYAVMTEYSGLQYMTYELGYRTAIAKIDTASGTTEYIKPADENIIYPTLCIFNGALYSIGGFDVNTSNPVKTVYKLNFDNTWQKAASLPEARAMGKCIACSSSKMIYALGTDGTENVPQNLIFDGSKWTVSKAEQLKTNKKFKINVNKNEVEYYICGIGLVKNALMFTDVQFENLGDIFSYNIKADSFEKSGKYYHRSKYDFIRGIIVNDTYYGTAVCDTCHYDITDEEMYTEDYYKSQGDYPSTGQNLYTFNVDTAYCQVTSDLTDYGTVYGTGAYLSGEKATINVEAYKPYKVVSIVVNGTTYKGSTATFTVKKDTNVIVNYKELVSSVKLSAKSKTLKLGKKFTLKATILSKTATNKKMSWSYSKKGILKAVKKTNTQLTVQAKKKGTTYVIIKAKDGSKKSAKCKIKVTK